jgi:hypothetical protein
MLKIIKKSNINVNFTYFLYYILNNSLLIVIIHIIYGIQAYIISNIFFKNIKLIKKKISKNDLTISFYKSIHQQWLKIQLIME